MGSIGERGVRVVMEPKVSREVDRAEHYAGPRGDVKSKIMKI